jgi:hypothetical protein
MPKKTRKKSHKKTAKNKRSIHQAIPAHLAWCVLGLLVAISSGVLGNEAAALAKAGDNHLRQVERQPVAHFSGRSSSSPMLMRRQGITPPCADGGTACSLTPGQRLPENRATTSRLKIDVAQFKLMKKNSNQFGKLIADLKSQTAALQKQNISLPDDLSQALSALVSYLGQIKKATSSEAIQDMPGGLFSAMQKIQQRTPQLPQLTQLSKLIKQAQTQLDQAAKTYANDQKRAAKSPFSLTVPLTDYNYAITHLQSVLDQVKTESQTDLAAATSSLQNDFYNNLNTLQIKKLVLDIALTPRTGLQAANQMITDDQKQINALKKKGTDTAQLTAQIAQAKSQAAKVKISLASSSITVADTLIDIQNLASILQSISNNLPAKNIFTPVKPGSNFQPPMGFMMNSEQTNSNQPPAPEQNTPANPLPPGQVPPLDQTDSTNSAASLPANPPPPQLIQ